MENRRQKIEDQLEGRSQSCWVSDDAEGEGAATAFSLYPSPRFMLSDLHLRPGIGPFLRLSLSSFPQYSFSLGHMQLATFSSPFPSSTEQREEFTLGGSILEESHQFFCLLFTDLD